MFNCSKSFIETKETKIEPVETQIEPKRTHCFMAFHSSDNDPFSIQDVLDGEWNKLVHEELDSPYIPRKIYNTEEEAAQSLYKMTRSGNLKAAYIVELGVDLEQAKDFIRKEQFNSIIIKAINYKDRQKKARIKENNPSHEHEIKVEVIENPNFKPSVIQSDSAHKSRQALAIGPKLPIGDAPVQCAREFEKAPA